MAKKCTPSDPILRDASVEISKKKLQIEASYDNEFGAILDRTPLIKDSIKKLSDNLIEQKLKLNYALKQKDSKAVVKYIKKIKLNKQSIQTARQELKNAPKTFALLNDLRTMLVGNLMDWAEKRLYDINPDVYFPVIKDYLRERYGKVYHAKSTPKELASVKKRLGVILSTQVDRDDSPINLLKDQHQDPGILMLKEDPTSLAYDLINKTRRAPEEIFGVVNKYNNQLQVIEESLQGWVKLNNYLFKVNLPENEVVNDDTLAESYDNIIKFAFDVMDGRAKYIIPMPIGMGKKENSAFKRDEKAYNEIVRKNIFNEINEGGDIQKLTTPQGQTFYYVTIKQPIKEHKGAEVYYAYQVPHKPGKEKEGVVTKDFLLLPRSNKKGSKATISRKEYDESLGQDARLASYTNDKGQSIQGRMAQGWYEAKTYKPLSGIRKENKYGIEVKVPMTVFSYSSNKFNENINTTDDPLSQGDLPVQFWEFISRLRKLLNTFHLYATDKNRTTEKNRQEIVRKINKVGSSKMSTEELNALISEALSIDGLRANMAIDDEGNLITSNTFFGELFNYIPWRYTISELISGHVKARDALMAKLQELTHDLENNSSLDITGMDAQEVLDLNSDITSITMQIEEMEGLIQHFEDMVDISAGLKSMHDSESLNQVQMIAAAQHRKGFINPFPTYDEDGNKLTEGRLANMQVLSDYIYDTARNLVHNDLRNNLLNVLLETSPAVSEFMLDHVKATFGNIESKAGAFGLDYSNPTIAKKLTQIFKNFRGPDYEITSEQVHRVARMHSMFISGNLLLLASTLNNAFQRISVWIELGAKNWKDITRIYKGINPDTGRSYAKEIAEASGATDVTIGLADALMGIMSDDLTMGTGFFAKADFALLQLSKMESLDGMKKSIVWRRFFSGLIKRRTDQQATATQLEHIYDGVWELINGIDKGSLSEKQLKGIRKNLEAVLSSDLVNEYASWGLKGSYAAGIFKKTGLDKFLTFSGVEEQMREWTAVAYAVEAVNSGEVPQDVLKNWKDYGLSSPYVHPNALKMARIGNNVTMFGLSPQHLSKMFRGGVGALFWKFKPYHWHQGRREMLTVINWMDSLSESDLSEIVEDAGQALLWPLFGLGRKLTGRKPKPRSSMHEKLKRLIYSRGLISLIMTPMFYAPIISEVQKLLRNQFSRNAAYGTGLRAMGRGGESFWVSAALKAVAMLGLIGGFINPEDEEDEERIWKDSRRYFLPFYINLALEAAQGSPMDAVRAYSQSAYRLASLTKDTWDWAMGNEEGED